MATATLVPRASCFSLQGARSAHSAVEQFDRAETADQRVNVAVQSRDMCTRDYRCKIYSKTVKLSI